MFGDFIIDSASSVLTTEYPVRPYSGLTVAMFSNLIASNET